MALEDLMNLTSSSGKKMESSSSPNKPTNGKLFSRRILSNIGSASSRYESSFRVYYPAADAAISVPFTWESQPGTPKHHSLDSYSGSNLPPLTPPPSFYNKTKTKTSSSSSSLLRRSSTGGSTTKLKIFYLSGLLGRKRNLITSSHVSPTTPSTSYASYYSSSSSSGSSSTLSVSSDSPRSPKSRWRRFWIAPSSSSPSSSNSTTLPLRHQESPDARAVAGTSGYFICFGGGHARSKSSTSSCCQFTTRSSSTNRALDYVL